MEFTFSPAALPEDIETADPYKINRNFERTFRELNRFHEWLRAYSIELTTDVAGVLPVANGGLGVTSFAVGDLLYADTTTSLATLAAVATGRLLASAGVSTAPAWSASPSLATSLTVPLLIGGTGATSTLTLKTTTGAPGGNMLFLVGNNGIIEAMRVLNSGNIGLGVTSPLGNLHFKAGTGAAGSAPIVLNSGTLLITPIAGAVEFLTDNMYLTISTGAARKAFVLDNGTLLTSGRVPFATTNGRLTDNSLFTFASGVLTVGTAPASTNTILSILDLRRETSGTAAIGIGLSQRFLLESNAGNVTEAARLEASYQNVSDGNERTRFSMILNDQSSAREVLRLSTETATAAVWALNLAAGDFSSPVSTGGTINLANGSSIMARNAADTGDLGLIDVSASNALGLGGSGGVTAILALPKVVFSGNVNHRATSQKVLFGTTSDAATAVELTTDGAAGSGTTNRITVPNNTALSVVLNICVKQSGSANSKQMLRQFVIANNGGTTALEGAVTTLGTDIGSAGLATVTTTITANDTDDAIKVEVNGVIGTNLRYTAYLVSAEALYA